MIQQKIKKMSKIYTYFFLLLISVGITAACSDRSKEPEGEELADNRLMIAAGSADMLATKAYTHDLDSGNIKSGIYYLSYPNDDSKKSFSLATVNFDFASFSESRKRYYTYTIDPELLWSDVKQGDSYLYLDNVKPEYGSASNSIVTFNTSNPFVSGLMDDSNDLLWGSASIERASNYVDFKLHHVMAGVRVKITIDKSETLADQFDLSNAELYLTNIVHVPRTYSRITGDVTIADTPEFENLTLVDILNDGQNQIKWADSYVDDEGNDVYITNNFILPPQSPDINQWPELVVRFPNPSPETQEAKPYLEYFGYLPHAMETDYVGDTNYAMNLGFLREHILEIRTKISQNPPQLVFMPVKVYKWINWGPYTLNANQSGIYSAAGLLNVITYYNNNDYEMLDRFGELRTNESGEEYWYFNIFRHIKIDLSGFDTTTGIMNPNGKKYDFRFNLNNRYRVTVTVDDNGTSYVFTDNNALYNFLAYGTLPTPEEPEEPGQP